MWFNPILTDVYMWFITIWTDVYKWFITIWTDIYKWFTLALGSSMLSLIGIGTLSNSFRSSSFSSFRSKQWHIVLQLHTPSTALASSVQKWECISVTLNLEQTILAAMSTKRLRRKPWILSSVSCIFLKPFSNIILLNDDSSRFNYGPCPCFVIIRSWVQIQVSVFGTQVYFYRDHWETSFEIRNSPPMSYALNGERAHMGKT